MSHASATQLIEQYLAKNYRVVFWPQVGDLKGPKEPGWPHKLYTLADYRPGYRVGLITGVEVAPERFMHDVDIDWTPGANIAMSLLPSTNMLFGRSSKKVSHCFYTLPEALPTIRYEDIDKTCLIELRGTKLNGDLGFQTMVPPSVWSKGTLQEPLTFVKADDPTHIENLSELRQRVCLSAIGMLFAKHLGHKGFGHEVRLAWAGYLLRAGISIDELVLMGEAIAVHCGSQDLHDVRRVLESTAAALSSTNAKKVKGGPSLAKIFGEHGRAILARVHEWLGRDSDFLRSKDGLILKDAQENILRALHLLDVNVSYHEFTERMMVEHAGKTSAFDDATLDAIWLRIDRELHFRPTFVFYERVIKAAAREAPFHAVRDYLNKLVWDHVPRLDVWLIGYAGAEDSDYVRAVSSIALIAAVRRVRSPGCKYDEMLVLESQQGMNKSSALRALCPDESWFSDDLPLNVDSKQVIERTLGKWLIEASDLAGKRKAEVEQLKSMLSRQVDGPARMAYAHNPVERPRQFILIGTTNSTAYLTDTTGSRRYWPIGVRSFDVAAIKRDRDQLWAEAAAREASGESIRLPESMWDIAGQHQEQRRGKDAWEDLIRGLLLNCDPGTRGVRRCTTDLIWNTLGVEPARRDRTGGTRIHEIMQQFGFRRATVRGDDKLPQSGYVTEDPTKLVVIDRADDYDEPASTLRLVPKTEGDPPF